MDAERWRKARELFDSLADVPASEWESRLSALSDDAEVRAEALALLRADAEVTAHTAVSAHAPELLDAAAEHEERTQSARLVGRRLGPFALVREIGRGGMGQVWLAQRVDGQFEQQVAIKLLRYGWDDADASARFRAERQILASLTHPNIAHLIDGGVDEEGRPWLALEYVDGSDLRAHCDARRLDLSARLRLFLTVCDAVSYAHARLVVHRDIKPSNVLVAGESKVKLLDFGIAKLIQSDTATSATRVFTPEYAAPEQVRGEAITTAVDVYALGLLLYELLTGRRPYKLENSTPAAYERAILDQEPTRPSLAVTRRDEQIDADALAAQRELSPQRLRRELRGDLDAIVLKALRKEPAQRYASVGEFAEDVKRYLDREPVTARRGNWRYRAARFVQRHTLAASLALLALLSLVGGLGAALWQAHVARAERDRAETQAESARRIAAFLQGVFENANPDKRPGEQVTAQQLLAEGARAIHDDLKQQPQVRAALLQTLGMSFHALGDVKGALPLTEEAVTLRAAGSDRNAESRARVSLGQVLSLARRYDESIAEFEKARDVADRSTRAGVEAHARALSRLGVMLSNNGKPTEAIAAMQQALATQRTLYDPEHDTILETIEPLAYALSWEGRAQEAFDLIDPLWQRVSARTQPGDVTRRKLIGVEIDMLQSLYRYVDALPLAQEDFDMKSHIYGPEHREALLAEKRLGLVLYRANRPDEALPLLQHVIAGLRVNRATIISFPKTLRDVARALDANGRSAEAIDIYAEALQLWRERKPPPPGWVANSLIERARAERRAGRHDDAGRDLAEAEREIAAHAEAKEEEAALRIEQMRLALRSAGTKPDCTAIAAVAQQRSAKTFTASALAEAQAVLLACYLAAGQHDTAAALLPALRSTHGSPDGTPFEREAIQFGLSRWDESAAGASH